MLMIMQATSQGQADDQHYHTFRTSNHGMNTRYYPARPVNTGYNGGGRPFRATMGYSQDKSLQRCGKMLDCARYRRHL